MRKLSLAVAMIALCVPVARAVPAGHSAADYLTIMPNARAAAMGDGTIALTADEPSVAMVNPASLAGITRPWLSFHYASLPGDIPYHFTSFAMPTSLGIIGASFAYVPYNTTTGYDVNGKAIGVPNSYDMAGMVTVAIPIRKTLPVTTEYGSVGATMKVLHETMSYFSSEAFALDLGGIVRVPGVKGLTAGVAFKNFGSAIKFATESYDLPSGPSFGLGYRCPSVWDMALSADYLGAMNGPGRFATGISLSPVYFLSLRTSYRNDADSLANGVRMGLGLQFGTVTLDYAMTPLNYFSPTQTLSLCMSLGGITALDTASDYYLRQHFNRARELYFQKDYIEARQQFEEILSVYPDHLPSQRYLEKIIAVIEGLDQRKQDVIESWLRKADTAFAGKDFVTAGKYYNRVLKVSMDSGMAKVGIDRVQQMIAEVNREKVRQKNQAVISKLWKRAVARFRAGDYVKAKDDFKEILNIDANHTESKKYLVEIDNQLSKVAAARVNELFEQAMRLYKAKNYTEAMKYFDAVFIAAPHRLDAQDYSFKCQDAIDSAQRTERDARVAKEQEQVRSEMASLFDKALRYYERANYESAFEWFTKSEQFASQYEFDEYRENARNYLALVRNTLAERYYKRGVNYYRANDVERAAEEYKKALEYEPTNNSARTELDRIAKDIAQRYFERGMEYFSLSQMDKAREMFKKSLSFQPDKAESQRALERIR